MEESSQGDGGTLTVPGIRAGLRDHLLAWVNLLFASSPARQLLLMTATGVVVVLYGYHFGTYDQAIHLPSLKKFADPSLYPGDAFMELRWQHFSFFWILLVPFYRLGILEVTLLIAHIVTTYLTFWAIWKLSETLFENRLASVLSVVVMVLPHLPFGGWNLLEFSLLNRTFVLPFLLFAVVLYLRRRYVLAFALLGLMYNLHALSANFVLAMFLFDGLTQWRKIGARTILWALSAFGVSALPVLAWKLSSHGESLTLNREWLSIIARGMLSNTYFVFAPFPYLALFTVSGIGSIALYLIARRMTDRVRQNRTLTNFMLALLLLLVVHVVAVQWLPMTIVIQAQLIRAGVMLLLLSYLCFAYYLACLFQSHRPADVEPELLSLAFLFPFAFIPALSWLSQRILRARPSRWATTLALLGAGVGLSSALLSGLPAWSPGIRMYPENTPWYEVQIWARDYTPKNTVFITPSHPWSFMESDWRVFSERSTVATLPELMDVAFAPDYLDTWQTRFEAINPGALERLDGNAFTKDAMLRQAFYSLSEDDVVRAGCRFGAGYLVTDRPHPYAFEQVYANATFSVYAIPPETCSRAWYPR